MPTKIAINGFGRIGRLVLRALTEQQHNNIQIAAIGDIVPADNLAYLLKYDSTQGPLKAQITAKKSNPNKTEPDTLTLNGQDIPIVNAPTPAQLPWKQLGIQIVIEATGLFTTAQKAQEHLQAGAKKVIITAPAKGDNITTLVMGVNHHTYNPNQHHLISNASCTTNCLAPLIHVLLKENIGIQEGLMTTIHAYTATQKTVDGPSRKDWKGGRAAAINIIPSTTGAAKAVSLVIPQVQGKLTGMALRVPTPTASCVDLTIKTQNPTTYPQICQAMQRASQTYLKNILHYTQDEVVSSDFIHHPASSIFDAGAGIQLNNQFFKLLSWYDNEWGYSCRIGDLLRHILQQGI